MDTINPKHTIPEFYKNRNIFVTGATGFLGKIFLEKVLRCCPEVGNIYTLIRPKKGKGPEERIEVMLKDKLFDTLKSINPSQLDKIIPLQGDSSQLSLGLSNSNYTLLTSQISIIYHAAASVRFDDSLHDAILLNTRSTREVAHLALQCPNLEVLVHVSTTYCNCVMGTDLKEEFYPPPADWRQVIKIAETFDKAQLALLTSKYLGPYPNTYTFTKALGEHVIKDLCAGKIKAVICRPSIVVSTWKDPVEGWIDNFNGPVGLLVACGKGLLRCSYQDSDLNADYIPVDVTVKATIVASWDVAQKPLQDEVEVIHCSSGYHKWMTLGEVIRLGRIMSQEIPLNDCIWVPKGFISKCPLYAYFCTIFFHLIPAFFLDFGLRALGKKPILARLQMKIYNAAFQLRYFTFQEWNFCNKKFMALVDRVLETDKQTWSFDFRDADAEDFLRKSMMGARKYLLNESEDTLPQAKKHYQRMYWVDKAAMLILYGSVILLILHFEIIDVVANKVGQTLSYYFDGNMS